MLVMAPKWQVAAVFVAMKSQVYRFVVSSPVSNFDD